MEYKSSIIVVLISALPLVYGCGYFENDITELQKTVIGNIKIQKQENSEVRNLVFAETDEMYSVIVEECKMIYYDSINGQIFVESYINDSNSNYYEIEIRDALSKDISNAIKKNKIEYGEYSTKIKNISNY